MVSCIPIQCHPVDHQSMDILLWQWLLRLLRAHTQVDIICS